VTAGRGEAALAAELSARLEGEVIGPGDPAYDQRRRIGNARVDARPRAIARCASRDDVIAALAIGTDCELPIAVRSGGTSDAATVDGGIVIDVSALKAVDVDPASRTVSVAPGVTWAELDEATQEHGLAVTGARLSRLGVAGVALADGSGWLERALGPTGASLVGAEIVLADGRVVEANDEGDADLLWALRGAGSQLGVVTRVDLRLHAVGPTLLAGFLSFPRDRAVEVVTAYRDYMQQAPDEVGGGVLLGAGLGGVCTIVFSYLGTLEAGEEAVAELRELGPSLDAVAPNPYRALQRVWDDGNPAGTRAYVRGAFLGRLSDACLEAAVARADMPAASLSYVFLQPLGGALARRRGDEMALRVPDASWAYHCVGLWPPVASLDDGQLAWVDGFADALGPDALDAAYPSLIGRSAGAAELVATYGGDGYERLRRLRRRYDPGDVFGPRG
jgi:FAD/FMN-containing dehydrogenase